MTNKDYVKYTLLKSSPAFVSGEVLAESLNISRAAVSKIIKEFKAEGISIDSITNKGYKLSENSDLLSKELIKELLPEISDLDIYLYKSLDSTNMEAKRMLFGNSPLHDTLIISNEQSAGKGRKGRSFFSPKNTGIYLSYITDSPIEIKDSSVVTICVAVGVSRAIEKLTGLYPKIKWVNDLFLDEKKICGVLTEGITDLESGKIEKIIIGIGINYSTLEFPSELKSIATSIFNEKNANINSITRNHLIAAIVSELKILKNLDYKSFEFIIEEYRSKSNILGKIITLSPNENTSFDAAVLDINNHGHLVVKNLETKEVLTYNYGEVKIIK